MQRILTISLICLGLLKANTIDNLTAYWDYEGNLSDSAAAGLTADNGSWVSGGASNFEVGFLGQGIKTNGSDYVIVPNSSDISGVGNNVSISTWFKVASFSTNWQCLISQGEGSRWRIARSSGSSSLAYAGGRPDITASPNVADGSWHHVIAVTQSGVGTRIYIDGSLADENFGAPSIDTNSASMMIGNNVDQPNRIWNGSIDDTGIFSSALNDDEAKAIYDLALDPTYQFTLAEVNELFKLQTCTDGSTIQIGNSQWEAVPSDPVDGRDFIQLSADGSGVAGSDGPALNSFTADFTTVPAGYHLTLSWDVDPGATAISIDQGIGSVLAQTTNGVGSITLNPGPSTNTTYTLTVTNSLGSSSRALPITITNQPIIQTFSASPESIQPGNTVTLSWSTLNTTSLTLNGSPVSASGTLSLEPVSTTTYSLVAANNNGTVTESATVAVFINGEPIISEFSATNDGSLPDEDGEPADWIEITNFTSTPTIIDGTYFLTDDPNSPNKWAIPNQTIPAGGRIVVFASGKDRVSPAHANFSLSSNGEYLALLRIQGGSTIILSEFSDYPRQFFGLTYGVISPDLSSYKYLSVPTPNAANSGLSYSDFTRDTNFSVRRGLYTLPQSVVISSATVGAEIRYTTDGSTPGPGVGTLYTAPIPITTTTTLRAMASKPGCVPTNVDTHTYIFPVAVLSQPVTPPNWPASAINGQVLDYEMDSSGNVGVTDSVLIEALNAIPSLSVVTDQDNLTNSSTGIYVNAGNRGSAWERPASLELLLPPGQVNPDGLLTGFQQDGGLRIRGGFSRSGSNPKHAIRFVFQRKYGSSRLDFPLFGNEGDDSFEAIDIRTSQNYSWSFQNDNRNTFLREIFGRDSQRDMGQPYTRSRYYHLYLNGLYWGLYMTQERINADYAAQYFPGGDDEFDTVKSGGSSQGYNTEVIDGTSVDWNIAYEMAKNINGSTNVGGVSIPNFNLIQGLDESGLRDPALPVHVDMERLITYMLTVFYTGSFDAPLSTFIGASNNWFSIRNRPRGEEGWAFFAHDMEHSMGTNGNSTNRVGPFAPVNETFTKSNPQYLHQHRAAHPEYRLRFADITHREFSNDGAFTNPAVLARISAREATVTQVIDAEAARWGDSKSASPYKRSDWVTAVASLKNWTNNRNATVQAQLQSANLFPSVAPPVFSQHGGQVANGFNLGISGSGTIYYTTDGSDPRDSLTSGTSLSITRSMTVQARAWSGVAWSALTSADFLVGTTPGIGDLVISEINYHPSDPTPAEFSAGFTDDDDFEFIEIRNTSAGPIDLTDVSLVVSGSPSFSFGSLPTPADAVLSPGGHLVITFNNAGFSARYPGVPSFGDYSVRLSNNSDQVDLRLGDETVLFSVTYIDNSGWPESADGGGYSLVLNPNAPSGIDPSSWRLSEFAGGNPGANDTNPYLGIANEDDNGNGVANLVEAVLRDGARNLVLPTVGTIDLLDGGFIKTFPTLTLRRYLPVDNATITVQRSEDLSTWPEDAIEKLSSVPNGDGTVTEVFRCTIPLSDSLNTYFRVKISMN